MKTQTHTYNDPAMYALLEHLTALTQTFFCIKKKLIYAKEIHLTTVHHSIFPGSFAEISKSILSCKSIEGRQRRISKK